MGGLRNVVCRLAAIVLTAVTIDHGFAQSFDDLKNDEKTPGDVLVYGMGYSGRRFSPLAQINRDNAGKLVPVWAYSMADNQGGEAFPIVADGVIYTTSHNATVAVDALTGRQLWRTSYDYPAETLRVVCCGVVNRGAAIFNGKIIRTTLDNHVLALDAKTGKEIWNTTSPDPASVKNGYSMTGAPLVANGVVVVGVAGADFSHRGFIEGYDAETGKHLWRLYIVPAKGEPGSETWEGDSDPTGGSSWVTGSYDPELDLVYWGTGNPSPWNPRGRKGDNLFTDSIIAFRPKTGERVWFYQATPNDPFDFDAVQTPIIAMLHGDRSERKVIMQANRNGILYVLDAGTGKLLTANPFEKINWTNGINLETGRPNYTEVFSGSVEGKKVTVWPSVTGATNWQHASFNPETGLIYINTLHVGMTYEAPEPRKPAIGVSVAGTIKRTTVVDDPNIRGFLRAVDPMTGNSKWERPYRSPNFSSVLTTAGHLVFTGTMTGEFQAIDSDTGKLLWSFQTPSGIVGQPVTWERNGKQYITVVSGIGGVYATRSGDPNLANVPIGASLWTFALFDK